MSTIKQFLIKFIITLTTLFVIAGCAQNVGNKNSSKENGVDVAIILPLTGSDTKSAKEYAKMIKLGLSDGTKTKLRVTTYDSSNNETLAQSLDTILDNGVDIVIGPVFSEETKIVAEKLRGKGVVVISLSNNPVLADKQTYVFGHAPMRQLEQITHYFLDKNHKNFIALLPSGRYSNTVSKVLKDMIESKNANLAKVELYGNTPEDIEKAISSINETVESFNENDDELTRPVVFIADDPLALEGILSNIKKLGLDKRAIIAGDSRIDINTQQNITTTFTSSVNLLNYELPTKAAKFGINHLSFIHVLAYDVGRMVANSIGSSYKKQDFITNLNSTSPFPGASGQIAFVESIAQRKYDILKKENGNYKAVSAEYPK